MLYQLQVRNKHKYKYNYSIRIQRTNAYAQAKILGSAFNKQEHKYKSIFLGSALINKNTNTNQMHSAVSGSVSDVRNVLSGVSNIIYKHS